MTRARNNDSPESIIVANCRAKIERSLSLTRFLRPSVISRFIPVPDGFTSSGE